MKLSQFDIDKLNYWNHYVCTIDGVVTDLVTLNYGSQKLDLKFKFPRFKSLCYYETFRDYGYTFSKSYDFMELEAQLKDEAQYLLNIYSIEHEYTYG
jgi:hypothetical protein